MATWPNLPAVARLNAMKRLLPSFRWSRAIHIAALLAVVTAPVAVKAQTFGLFANAYLDSTRVP